MKNVFPLGFWNYTKCGLLDVEKSVNDWAELGMTLAMSSECSGTKEDVAYILETMDKALEKGIKIIVCDRRICWTNLTNCGIITYEKEVREAVSDFASHPAFYSFSVGDEPHLKEWADMETALRIVGKYAPTYVNFLPLYELGDKEFPNFGYDDYGDLIVKTVKETNLSSIPFDVYTQCNEFDVEKGLDNYFSNLNFYRKYSKKAGVPFWITLLSVGHWNYRVPTEDDLRWQISTATAFGAQGIFWFFLYERKKDSSYRLSPIDLFGERTPTFDSLKRENKIFREYFSERFLSSTLKEVWQYPTAYGGTKVYATGDIPDLEFSTAYGGELIVSLFERGGKEFVLLVNASQTKIERVEGVYGGKKFCEWFAPGQSVVLEK